MSKGWIPPADLRDRMLSATRRGTNLDSNPTPRRKPKDEEARKEAARVYAREYRKRKKAEAK